MIESETLPTVVCGDFNAPALGPMYRRMTTSFQDSHRQAGIGYGFSFPGDITLPFTGGQWIRIDYVLASRAWDVLRCDVEQQMGSQHSAVISTLRLK
jgi:endonuclease/exonuclease/phosphatase (EEP) superfamily protein YafD